MSRAAADRLNAINRRNAAAEEPPPVAVEEKPRVSRQTVDLPYEVHVKLATWRTDTADALGVLKITNQELLTALVEVLLEEETTARKVRTKVSENRRLRNSETRR